MKYLIVWSSVSLILNFQKSWWTVNKLHMGVNKSFTLTQTETEARGFWREELCIPSLRSVCVWKGICHTPVLWGLTGLWANVPWPFCCEARLCVSVFVCARICGYKRKRAFAIEQVRFLWRMAGFVIWWWHITWSKLLTWQKRRCCSSIVHKEISLKLVPDKFNICMVLFVHRKGRVF